MCRMVYLPLSRLFLLFIVSRFFTSFCKHALKFSLHFLLCLFFPVCHSYFFRVFFNSVLSNDFAKIQLQNHYFTNNWPRTAVPHNRRCRRHGRAWKRFTNFARVSIHAWLTGTRSCSLLLIKMHFCSFKRFKLWTPALRKRSKQRDVSHNTCVVLIGQMCFRYVLF